ncbi:HFL067Cp [Eremothecium sinecaudum]|uniref:AP complex subunit beta n=1 Tax=Eremothecium sinecaudum TaxID=45286 RepID=A0A0X8HUR3_9SACH|nr:HFL067Cp [Eremothecium sinecaudum]AMD21789.1 HFL067Cp [Eremothecium sinecaudum]
MDKKIKKFLKDAVRVAPKISNKGELFELKNGLVSKYPQTRKDAIKKTIQQMTIGKDVSSLFPDVLKNIATPDVEQKKLVYLYIINYAQTHPELCILAVNTFVTDAQDPNPLIRCMAIRTMSMIRVDKMLGHVEVPLRKTLQDDNPYVRKTAVICVAKLFQLNRQLCKELNVITDLISALDDENPMVVANTVAALTEIYEMENTAVPLSLLIDSHMKKFLTVLNECTEWARITILSALAQYGARDSSEAQDIIFRVTPHLQHVNPAVVLASVKVLVKNLDMLTADAQKQSLEKVSTALVSLMSTPPEMQYVALRNIRILLQKYPELLAKELCIFYVKFNDPLYIKLEKMDIMVRLASNANTKQCTMLLNELREYAMEFEPEFVSKAIQAISQLTIKFSNGNSHPDTAKFSNKVMEILCSLLQDRDTFQDECLISICDLLRFNPDLSKLPVSIISTWTDAESRLVTDYGKCNYIWLVGEHQFSQAEEKLQQFIESFPQQGQYTQLALLVTVMKLHKKLPESTLQHVLNLAVTQTQDIDIRDMAIFYSRCLSLPNSKSLIKELCTAKLPNLTSTLDQFSTELLHTLLNELSTLSSIYYKPLSQFKKHFPQQNHSNGKNLDSVSKVTNAETLLDLEDTSNTVPNTVNVGSGTLAELSDLFNFNGDPLLDSSNSKKSTDKETVMASGNSKDLLDLF